MFLWSKAENLKCINSIPYEDIMQDIDENITDCLGPGADLVKADFQKVSRLRNLSIGLKEIEFYKFLHYFLSKN
jgi:hypothetical protein